MFILKRSWLYVSRKIGKVSTIGFILFIVATLVITGFLIETAANNSYEVARNKLGAAVTYTTDISSAITPTSGGGGRGMGFTLPADYTSITTKEIETIVSTSKYIDSFEYNVSVQGTAINFHYFELEETTNNDQSRPNISSNVSLSGIDITSSQLESSDLLSGALFTTEQITNNENVIIIEATIANNNNLVVGDTVNIAITPKRMPGNAITGESSDITFTIVGIYETKFPTELSDSNITNTSGFSENKMYAPYTTVLNVSLLNLDIDILDEKLLDIEINGYDVNSVTFNLHNIDEVKSFILEVESMKIDQTYRKFNDSNDSYETMTSSIANVASTASIMVIVVVIAGALIIGLLSMLSIKDRKYEIGVLLSLGESRFKIMLQLVIELLIITIIAFSLATFTSNYTAQATTNYLLNQEIESIEKTEVKKDLRLGFGKFGQANLESIDTKIIDELEVSMNISDVVKTLAIGVLIIIITNMIQAIFVLKSNPKEIMLER